MNKMCCWKQNEWDETITFLKQVSRAQVAQYQVQNLEQLHVLQWENHKFSDTERQGYTSMTHLLCFLLKDAIKNSCSFIVTIKIHLLHQLFALDSVCVLCKQGIQANNCLPEFLNLFLYANCLTWHLRTHHLMDSSYKPKIEKQTLFAKNVYSFLAQWYLFQGALDSLLFSGQQLHNFQFASWWWCFNSYNAYSLTLYWVLKFSSLMGS